MRRIYLDHNATTPVRPEAARAVADCLAAGPGNPSSPHRFGRAAARRREEAREALAGAAGCAPDEVVFTSGGTEADNLALRGLLAAHPRGHLVTAATEHEAILATARALEAHGAAVTVLPVDEEGRLDLDRLAAAIRPDTRLVSLMAANNETGVLHPIREIGRLCRERGVLFHTDAVQAFGKIPFRFAELPLDLASLSSHKIGGPPGAGALLVRRGVDLCPLLTGGAQEAARRPGTENLPSIAGFATAARLAAEEIPAESRRLRALRDRLERGIREAIPGARVNGGGAERLPNTANVTFPGAEGESLLMALDLEGIAASTGAACTAGAAEPSHVLRAMGRSREEAGASIRFSLGTGSTEPDIVEVLAVLPQIARRAVGSGATAGGRPGTPHPGDSP